MSSAKIKGPGSDDGLDELVRRHTAQRPEEKKRIEVIADEKFKELWGKYKQALNLVDTLKVDLIEDYLDMVITDVLTPQDIEEFFRLTIAYEECTYYQKCTAKIINKLIENSHNAGYDGFVLNTKYLTKPLDNLCDNLKDAQKKPIHITINGNVGNDCGSQTECSLFLTINGDVGSCGRNSKWAYFIINGNVGYISNPWKCSFFNINGNLKQYYVIASDCSLSINGEIETFKVEVYSVCCTFKTSNTKTLDVFLKHVPLMRGHKVYFINEDGTETKIGAWDRFVKRVGYKIRNEE